MKILVWNLKNISVNGLSYRKITHINLLGLGTNLLDFISRLVSGASCWDNIPFLRPGTGGVVPIDIFVIIEAKHAGSKRGDPVSTTYNTLMSNICSGIKSCVSAQSYGHYTSTPAYDYLKDSLNGGPIITTGKKNETVGIIYNTNTITYVNASNVAGLLNDITHTTATNVVFPAPRAPFLVNFTIT